MRRIRPANVLLSALIAILASWLVIGQRREAGLREALALYKERARDELRDVMRSRVPLNWPEGTPLRDVVERIADGPPSKSFSRARFPRGLPILVDPDGLREAGRTLDSPVGAPPPDPASGWPDPLRQRLESVLGPLGLAAAVKDGAIVITSRGRAEASDEPDEEDEP